jgi:hypothetical protein
MKERLEQVLRAVGLALTVAAVTDAVRRRRTHGEALGFVPYDFRPPRGKTVRRRLWAPDDERLITPTVFGVGWTVNVGRVARLLGLR